MAADGPHITETGFEHWTPELEALGLPRLRIELSKDDLIKLGAATPGFAAQIDAPVPDAFSEALTGDLNDAFAQMDGGAHMRLGMVSFKAPGRPALRVLSASHALVMLSQPNRRVAAILREAVREGHDTALFLLPWVDIEPWCEFRIFIQAGTVLGVTQYDTRHVFPEVMAHSEAITDVISEFCARLLPVLHLPAVVADVFVHETPEGLMGATLIELNPFVQRTDPCLFTWARGGDFDGSFRYRSN